MIYYIYMEPQPPSASVPPRHTSITIVGILLTFVILLLIVFFFARDYFKNYFTQEEVMPAPVTTVKNEFSDMLLLSKVGAYTVTQSTTSPVPYAIGIPELFERFSQSRLTVIQEGSEFVVRENDQERFRSSLPITSLSVTPNTKLIAYSSLESSEADQKVAIPAPFQVENIAHAEISVYFPQTNTVKRIVNGHAPMFVNDQEFIFLSPSGVYRYNLTRGEATQLIDRELSVVGDPVLSTDSTQFAFYDFKERATLVYELKDGGATLKTSIPELLLSPALHRGVLYSLRSTEKGTEVLRFNLITGSSTQIFTAPSELSVHRITF